jgi:hypothetical protein
MMAMGDRYGIHVFLICQAELRQAFPPVALGMHARVQQQPVPFDINKPAVRSNPLVGVQARDSHVPKSI